MSGRSQALETATQICETLERVAAALVDLDGPALLDAESTLATLVASFEPKACAQDDRTAVEAVVRRGHAALLRCRRLGTSFTSVVRARSSAYGATYDQAGVLAGAAGSPATIRTAI